MNRNLISASIVSHLQAKLVEKLLENINRLNIGFYEIIITINKPESLECLSRFSNLPIKFIYNSNPNGFGRNHNAAFKVSRGDFFAVLNPDIEFTENFQFDKLLKLSNLENIAICSPIILNSDLTSSDSARRFPTIKNLIARRICFKRKRPDYQLKSAVEYVDWIGGMFMFFKSDKFRLINGFDENYFMYMEDVDLCRRFRDQSHLIVVDTSNFVIHHAQRASSKKIIHFYWHIKSAIRYFLFFNYQK